MAQNVLHGAGQIRRAVVGGNDHHHEVVAAVDDGVLHVGLCLCKLSIVAVESHLVLLVGLEGVHDVLCLASGGLDGQHQTGVAVVVALEALVAGHIVGFQAKVVLDVHGRYLKLVGDGVSLQQGVYSRSHGVGSAVLLSGNGSCRLGRSARAGGLGGRCGRGCRRSRAAAACQQDTARSQRSSRKDEFQTNIHKRFPSFVVKILRPGRPENCRPETPR